MRDQHQGQVLRIRKWKPRIPARVPEASISAIPESPDERDDIFPSPTRNRCGPCRHSLPARARNHADLAHVGDAHHAARELLEGTGEDGRRHVEQFFVVGFLTAFWPAQAFRSFSSWRTNPQVERDLHRSSYCLVKSGSSGIDRVITCWCNLQTSGLQQLPESKKAVHMHA